MPPFKKETQVGPGKYNPLSLNTTLKKPALPGSKPVIPIAPVNPINPKASGIISSLDQTLADKGWNWDTTDSAELTSLNLIDTLSNTQLEVIGKMLQKKKYTVKASAQYIKNLFGSEPELISIASDAQGDYNKLVSLLASDILPGLAKGTGGENLPTRSIYKYNDEDVDAIINNVYQRKLMRPATPAELEEERAQAKIKLEQGTVTTTKKVKNPITGKLEAVVTQEAGPTKEVVEQSIEERIKALNPDEADRTARIEFSSWLSQNVQGA
jgi:hypothetical protein